MVCESQPNVNKKIKQACDRCKIARLRCEREDADCKGCIAAKTSCRFTIVQKKRGPRECGMMKVVANKRIRAHGAQHPDPFIHCTKSFIIHPVSLDSKSIEKASSNLSNSENVTTQNHNLESQESLSTSCLESTFDPLIYLIENNKSILEWHVGLFLNRTTRDLVSIMFWRLTSYSISRKIAGRLLMYLKAPINPVTVSVIHSMAALGSALLFSGPLKPDGTPYIFHTNHTQHIHPSNIYDDALKQFRAIENSFNTLDAMDTDKMDLSGALLRQAFQRLKP